MFAYYLLQNEIELPLKYGAIRTDDATKEEIAISSMHTHLLKVKEQAFLHPLPVVASCHICSLEHTAP